MSPISSPGALMRITIRDRVADRPQPTGDEAADRLAIQKIMNQIPEPPEGFRLLTWEVGPSGVYVVFEKV